MDLRNIPNLASKMYDVVLKYNWLTEQMNKNVYIPDYEIKTILDSLKNAYWSMQYHPPNPPPLIPPQVPTHHVLPLPYNIPLPPQPQHLPIQLPQQIQLPQPIQLPPPLHPHPTLCSRASSPQSFRRSDIKRRRDDEDGKRYRDGDEPVKRRYYDKSSDYISLNTEKGTVQWISKTRCTNGPDCKFRPNCHFTHGPDN